MDGMKAKILAAFLAVVLLGGGAVCLAKENLPDYLGIWVLTKTQASITGTGIAIGPGGSPQLTLKTANAPVEVAFVFLLNSKGDVYATVSQILVDGQSMQKVNYSWKGKVDGSDYPVQGDPDADTWSYTQVNEHELQQTAKKDGKVVRQVTFLFHGKKCTISGGGVTAFYEREHTKGETDVVP